MQFLLFFIIFLISSWFYFKHAFTYWKKRNVRYIQPKIPFGSLGNPFFDKKGVTLHLKEAYDLFKSKGEELGGLFVASKPVLLAISPEIVKIILHTAFDHFESHGNYFDEKSEPLGAHLLNLEGRKWKTMREKLTPTFTSGKMKIMFQTVLNCGAQLEDHINVTYQKKEVIDIKRTMACFTTDVIGSCAFGLECNSFKNPEAEFLYYGKKAFEGNLKTALRRFGNIVSPGFVKMLKLPLFDVGATNFFMGAIKKIVDYRKINNVRRNDFVQILLDMKEVGFTVEEIAAQAFVFFLAGFETTSTTLTFCLFELAHHQMIQEKVREEINLVTRKYDGKITYESVKEMKYLEQVIKETLRKYPPLPVLKRSCTKDYQFPNGLKIHKGNIVYLSVLGLHRDEEFYSNPEEFNPERFSDEIKGSITPYTFVPFGEGPRMCIGRRFGWIQTIIGLCSILKNHKVSPCENLRYPIEYEHRNFMLNAKGSVFLKID